MLLEATLAYFSAVLCYVATAARHLRATWRQDESQEKDWKLLPEPKLDGPEQSPNSKGYGEKETRKLM